MIHFLIFLTCNTRFLVLISKWVIFPNVFINQWKPNVQVWFSNRRAKWRRHHQQTPTSVGQQQQNRTLESPSTISSTASPILGSLFRPYNEMINNFILQSRMLVTHGNGDPGTPPHRDGNLGRTENLSSDHGLQQDEPQIDVDWYAQKLLYHWKTIISLKAALNLYFSWQ